MIRLNPTAISLRPSDVKSLQAELERRREASSASSKPNGNGNGHARGKDPNASTSSRRTERADRSERTERTERSERTERARGGGNSQNTPANVHAPQAADAAVEERRRRRAEMSAQQRIGYICAYIWPGWGEETWVKDDWGMVGRCFDGADDAETRLLYERQRPWHPVDSVGSLSFGVVDERSPWSVSSLRLPPCLRPRWSPALLSELPSTPPTPNPSTLVLCLYGSSVYPASLHHPLSAQYARHASLAHYSNACITPHYNSPPRPATPVLHSATPSSPVASARSQPAARQ